MGLDPGGLRARAAVLHALRTTLHGWGYLEVPTPVLVGTPGVEPTLVAVSAGDRWLRTSPELALKRVVAAGLPRVYELGPCARDDEHGPWHRREFLMLEWYRAGATLPDLMAEVEALVRAAADALGVSPPGSWRTARVRDLYRDQLGVDPWTDPAHRVSPDDPDDADAAFFRRWVADIEPTLTEPTFVVDWPPSQAAAARVLSRPDGLTTARFEAYLGGVELANAFLELTNGREQRARMLACAAAQAQAGAAVWPVDEAFLDAVDRLPPCAGIALGVDRLVAALAGWRDIGPGRVDAPEVTMSGDR